MNDAQQVALQKVLAWCGLLSPLLFWRVVAVLGIQFPDYSHLRDTVSQLGANGTSTAPWQNANFLITGGLVAAFAWGLQRGMGGRAWGPGLLAIFGVVGLMGSGLLPCDPGCTGNTLADQLHFIPSSIGFPCLLAGLFVVARRMGKHSHWAPLKGYTCVTAWFGLAMFLAMNAAFMGGLPFLMDSTGLVQRLFTGSAFVWIFFASRRLLVLSGESRG